MPLRSEPRELKHLSTGRKRKRIDSVSSGERKRRSPNGEELRDSEGNGLGGPATEGDSPVPREGRMSPRESTPGHEKPRRKTAGPPAKAKHRPVTDSEQVP